MSEIKTPHFKVTGRRYSHLKQTLSRDGNPVVSSLPDGEAFYQQMFERNRAVKLVVDPSNAKIVKANQAALDFYGYTSEQFKSLRVTDITVLPEAKLLADMERTLLEKGATFEARHRLASGEIRDVEIFSGSIEFKHKPYLYAIIQDVTSRKNTEKALRESEALYRLLAHNIPNSAVFMFDNNMRYMLADGPFLKRFGSLYDNVVGKTVQESLPEAAATFITPIYQRALQGESFSYDRVLDDYAYHAFVTPLRNEEGAIIGGMILSQDITETKKTQKALHESEALYRLFTQNMPNTSVIMFDTEMRFTLADGGFLKRAGLISDTLIGKKPHEVFTEETLNFMLPLYQRTLSGESFAYDRVTSDYAYQSYANPLKNSDGEVIGGMFLTYDVTEAKQAEAALRKSEALYRLLAREMPNTSVVMYDRDLHFTLAEGSYLKRFGSVWDNAVGKTPQDVYKEEQLKVLLPIYKRGLQGENFTFERVTKDYAYQAYVTPLWNDNGEIIGGMILSHDITDYKLAESALRASEARFHSLVDLAPVGIIQTDVAGNRTFCNSHWCEMTGITLEQALSDERYETIYPEDLSIAAGAWEGMMESNLPFDNAVFRYQRPDKTTVWVSGNGRPLFDDYGLVIGYLGTVTDISEHKMLEDTLVISESRFRTLINFAPVGIVETDAQGNIMLTNKQWSALSGVSEISAFSGNASSTIHPDDLALTQAIQQQTGENAGTVDNVEYRFLHPDGKLVWVSDSSRPIFDELGNVNSYIITMTDITERKRLEEALRQNEERLRNITDNLQDMVSQSDADGLFTFVSPSYHTTLGYEVKSLIGMSAMDMIHPEDVGRVVQAFQNAFERDTYNFNMECRLRHIDGHYIDVDIAGKLFFDSEAKFMGGVFISRDISERKRLQNLLFEKEKLQGALDKEHELSALKTRMMERIAHEFRTPLTVIQAATETLTYYFDRLTPDQRNAKGITIKGQIQRLTDMLQEIGLVVNGNFTPDHVHRQSTDVSVLCHELATELERQLNFPGKYVLNLPESTIASLDPHVTKNAIRHIMRNAARFSNPSSVVRVSLSRDEKGITLRVTDTGIGIPSLEQLRLFEPFFRGSNIGEISGLGVGLTIARAAIEAQGGTIKIESVVGQGTTVTIWFPK